MRVNTLGEIQFANSMIGECKANIREVTINNESLSNTLTSMDGAFNGCTNLTKVVMKNVQTIPNWTFSECTALTCISAVNMYEMNDTTTSYPCDLSIVYDKLDTDVLADMTGSPVWKDIDYKDDTKIKVYIHGFQGSSENLKLSQGMFAQNTILKSVTIDDNAILDATGMSTIDLSCPGYFQTAPNLEYITIDKKLLSSMFYDSDADVYSAGWFGLSSGTYLSSLIVEFKQNTIEEVLALANIAGRTGYPIGSLNLIPQIKCGDIYYNIAANFDTANYEVANQSSTPMLLRWSNSYYCWRVYAPIESSLQLKSVNGTTVEFSDLTQPLAFAELDENYNPIVASPFSDNENFHDVSSLIAIKDMGNSVTAICEDGFDSCTNLMSVDFPGLQDVGGYAFYGCYNLSTADFPNLQHIGYEAFSGCALTGFNLYNMQTCEASNPFNYCYELQTIRKNADNSNFTLIDSTGAVNDTEGILLIDNNTQTVLWCSISDGNDITVPTGVSAIAEYAFSPCPNLTHVNCSDVTFIDREAFCGANSLTAVDCNNVTSIGDWAFSNCPSLSVLNMQNIDSVPVLDYEVFQSNEQTISCYVKSSLVESFKTAENWADYYNDGILEFIGI